MKYETKFSIGDTVFTISSERAYRIVQCTTCQGGRTVKIGAEEFVCPKCDGKAAHPQYVGHKWFISHSGSVGKVTVEHTDTSRFYPDDEPLQVKYMIDSTGIGSGSVWEEEHLFPTRESAQAECDRRNGVIDCTAQAVMKESFKDTYGGWRNLKDVH